MEEVRNKRVTTRALIFLFIFLAIIVLLFSRFIYIQAAKEVQGTNLEELLERRWSESRIIEGHRGSIHDRNGDVLAEEITSYTIIAVLDDRFENHITDPRDAAQKLSSVLEIEEEMIENQLTRDAVQVELGAQAKNISFEKKKKVEELEIDGIIFREDPRRYYPNQTFASHIIGYTERDMSVARMGLESSLDEHLKQTNGEITYKKDGRNRRLVNAEEIIEEPKNGDDVFLTIDSRIQMSIEQTMSQVDEEYSPERMMAVVANAKTGEILGMSNRPSFNPNQYESIENYTNFNISSRFEPGSTMKIFTLAAAIEEGVFQGDNTFESGSYEIIDRTVRDHNQGRGWGEITYEEGFQRSSNVAFSKIALELLGPERLYEYVNAFGFRDMTGIDLPNEATGLIADQYRIDAATTSFGQGSAITPIQQIQAATAIANGGKMMKPYVIDRIQDASSGDIEYQGESEIKGEPISEETAKEVLGLMETVVTSDVGTGRPFAIDGFDVAGKTGTAQIAGETGGYLSGENIYSFLGMAPSSDPEVIVYVAVDRPDLEPSQVGSEPVSMIFRQVMEQSLQYLNIAPSDEDDVHSVQEEIILGNYEGESTDDVKEQLTDYGLEVTTIGNGSEIVRQSHSEGSELIHGERVILLTNDDNPLVPDVTNWSSRSVYLLGEVTGIDMDVSGEGFVQVQKPSAGSEMTDLSRMIIELSMDEVELPDEDGMEDGNDSEENDEDFFMD
ncbi:penicillin-binding protein [Salipaludibacillus daqingensis]|uniref:penicillin-binding protein n=1 Tax=Salipaludibacillus daqingensis TaxID=3041001 RepID=UPI002476EF69|nr:penicillin-binding protein [Salipaludibacillus daqingensis]